MSFKTTQWHVVLTASGPTDEARRALSELCSVYWRPVFYYIQGKGNSFDASMDLTQDFFLRLIDKDILKHADHKKGKFRTFLLVAVNRFLINEYERKTAAKRGGQAISISLDEMSSMKSHIDESNTRLSPEKIYERQWAIALLDSATQRLEQEYVSAERTAEFRILRPFIATGEERATYEYAARKLNKTEGAVRTSVHRVRVRFRELIREEIADTILDDSDIDTELKYLRSALSGGNN